MKTKILLLLLLICSIFSFSQECELVGDISVELISYGSTYKCVTTGNLLACAIGNCLRESEACNLVAKTGVTNGCVWVVKTYQKHGRKHVRFIIKSSKNRYYEMKRAYHTLNTVAGIKWLIRRLTH